MAGTSRYWLGCLAAAAALAGTVQPAVAQNEFGFIENDSRANVVTRREAFNNGIELQAGKATLGTASVSDRSDKSDKAVEVEIVKERYPNRAVKVERHVMLDDHRNYVNHGLWTMYSPSGTMMARGEYFRGNRQGKWTRWFIDEAEAEVAELSQQTAGEHAAAAPVKSDLLTGPEFEGFRRPFISEANFADGKLVGVWTIVDTDDRVICTWEFNQDQLQGTAVYYYPNGQKRREMQFDKGVLVGEWKEWEANGTASRVDTYIEGRRKVPYTERYDSGEKYCQGSYLYAKAVVTVKHDWWNGAVDIALGDDTGEKLKQGMWTYWFRNGGKLTEGEFEAGQPVAMHVWWYENGQQKAQGDYIAGQQSGNWIWWHENGIKKTEGPIVDGHKVGVWSEWKEDGTLAQERDHGGIPNTMNAQGIPPAEMQHVLPQPQARSPRSMATKRR